MRLAGQFHAVRGGVSGILFLGMLISGGAALRGSAQSSPVAQQNSGSANEEQSKFYCNMKVLTPEERTHHAQLTEKILAVHRDVVEIEKGYELQFSPADISLAELADWTVAESKCCPFFDFHLDLERRGTLLCLRLTGEEGIKAFIRNEFRLAGKM
jgi:hypothetical protein